MDRTGFELIDQEYKKELKALQAKIRADIEQEVQDRRGFKFSEHQTDALLAKYPYSPKGKDKAQEAQKQVKAIKEAQLQEEVAKRLKAQQSVLEELHFGKQGRDSAQLQADREEKIKAFKERQRQKEAQEQKAQSQTTEQSKKQTIDINKKQKAKISPEQNNAKPLNMNADFNTETAKGKAKVDIDQKIEAFKARQLQSSTISQNLTQTKNLEDNSAENNKMQMKDDFIVANSIEEHVESGSHSTKETEINKEEQSTEDNFKARMWKEFASQSESQDTEHDMDI